MVKVSLMQNLLKAYKIILQDASPKLVGMPYAANSAVLFPVNEFLTSFIVFLSRVIFTRTTVSNL